MRLFLVNVFTIFSLSQCNSYLNLNPKGFKKQLGIHRGSKFHPELSQSFEKHFRIHKGWESPPGLFPFMVSVFIAGNQTHCGGALLTMSHIITAAHCVENKFFAQQNFVVKAGMHNQFGGHHQTRKILSIVIHPKYERVNHLPVQDLAIIKTEQPFTPSGNVQKIKIIKREIFYPKAGQLVKLLGWGQTSPGVVPAKLQGGNFLVASHDECRAIMTPLLLTFTERNICLKSRSTTPCLGDSGGPVFVLEKGDASLIAIQSISNTICHLQGENPAITTNVNFYRDWIKGNLY